MCILRVVVVELYSKIVKIYRHQSIPTQKLFCSKILQLDAADVILHYCSLKPIAHGEIKLK